MKHKLFLLMCTSLSLISFTISQAKGAEKGTVDGVYQNNLVVYSEQGKKLEQLSNVTDDEIKGTDVLARTPRNLIKINFRGKDVWLRAGQLKLSTEFHAACPEAAPGKSADRATPVSSGMGAKCDKNK